MTASVQDILKAIKSLPDVNTYPRGRYFYMIKSAKEEKVVVFKKEKTDKGGYQWMIEV